MANLYRQRYTKKIPACGEIVTVNGEKKVKVVGRDGRTKMYECTIGQDGSARLAGYSTKWYICYRDSNGIRRHRATGCRDRTTARAVLAKVEQQLEHLKAGLISKQDLNLLQQREAPIEKHVKDYLQHLEVKTVRGRSVSKGHRHNVGKRLRMLLDEIKIETFQDITAETLENWMLESKTKGRAPRTINTYRSAIVAFCNWALRYKRIKSNPLALVFKADESSDIRHERRAMTTDEVARLLKAAELRPVAEFGRLSKALPREHGKKQKWKRLPITWDTLDECYARGVKALEKTGKNALERYKNVGLQRKLAYRVFLTTGLRKKELKAVTPDRLKLTGDNPTITLPGTATKNGKAAILPLRPEIAAALKQWIETMEPFPTDQVFDPVPTINNFNLDIAAANIAKRDHRNRVVDIHALRHTFGTHLAVAGVSPRTAMAAMRHSRIDLTMNIYTDPALLDVAGAVQSLPDFGAK